MTKYGKEKRNVRNKNTGTKTVTRNRKVRSKNSKCPKRKSSKNKFRTHQGVTKRESQTALTSNKRA